MGILLALACALAFSFMNVFIRNGVRPGDRDNGVLTTLAVNVVLFTAALGVVAATAGIRTFDPAGVGWFVVAGLASTFFGRQALFAGIRRIGAARAAAIKNATPLVSVAIALGFLGERLTPLAAAGVTLIVLGIFALIAESLTHASGHLGHVEPDIGTTIAADAPSNGEASRPAETLADRTRRRLAEPSRRYVMVGVAVAGLSALFFGSGHAFRKVGMDLLPDALLGATIGCWAALAAYLALSAVRGESGTVLRTAISLRPWFVAAGLVGSIGQLSFFAALAFAPLAHVSVVAGSETVLTVLIAALIAGRPEAITGRVVLPAILVFAGTALIGIS